MLCREENRASNIALIVCTDVKSLSLTHARARATIHTHTRTHTHTHTRTDTHTHTHTHIYIYIYIYIHIELLNLCIYHEKRNYINIRGTSILIFFCSPLCPSEFQLNSLFQILINSTFYPIQKSIWVEYTSWPAILIFYYKYLFSPIDSTKQPHRIKKKIAVSLYYHAALIW